MRAVRLIPGMQSVDRCALTVCWLTDDGKCRLFSMLDAQDQPQASPHDDVSRPASSQPRSRLWPGIAT